MNKTENWNQHELNMELKKFINFYEERIESDTKLLADLKKQVKECNIKTFKEVKK